MFRSVSETVNGSPFVLADYRKATRDSELDFSGRFLR